MWVALMQALFGRTTIGPLGSGETFFKFVACLRLKK